MHEWTYEWKYIYIVNSSIFFLSEFEEVKGCMYRVETLSCRNGTGIV